MTRARALLAPAAVAALACIPVACTTPSGPDEPGGGDPLPPPATDPLGVPVFPLPEDPEGLIRKAQLNVVPIAEVPATHGHAHVDVIVDGKAVTVPAGIGVVEQDGKRTGLSPVHTRDATGVVHLDPRPDTYRVGQLFVEWDVELNKRCLASFCVDETHQLLAYANGELAPDPAAVPLTDGMQVVIWYGPKGSNPPVPVSYDFTTVAEP